MTSAAAPTFHQLVDSLDQVLQALRENGVERVEVLPDTLALLRISRPRSPRAAPPPPKSSRPATVIPPPRNPSPANLMQVVCRRVPDVGDSPEQASIPLRLVSTEENFRGEAGRLLLQMLTAIGYAPLARKTPFDPGQPVEWNLAFGAEAMSALLGRSGSLIMMRGRIHPSPQGQVMPTLAPVNVGANRDSKRRVWADLQEMIRHMGLSLPPKS